MPILSALWNIWPNGGIITFNSFRFVERTTKLVGLFGSASSKPGPDAANSDGWPMLLGLDGDSF